MKRKLVLAAGILAIAALAAANTYTVTTTADSGAGSLRQAILDANANPGADAIYFDIAGAGVQTIAPLTALPSISEPVTIDGYTQPGASANTQSLAQGSNAVVLIELDGENLGANGYGLTLGTDTAAANDVLVRGLAINRFGKAAIRVYNGDGAMITGNNLGPSPSGLLVPSSANPQLAGVLVLDGVANAIGGSSPADRNVISGNCCSTVDSGGIVIHAFAGASIRGNYIGTDTTGAAPLGNGYGFVCHGATDFIAPVTLGGAGSGDGNVVSGNLSTGVLNFCKNVVMQGNFIGTDATGSLPLGNAAGGVGIETVNSSATIGGTGAGEGNTIAYNLLAGVSAPPGVPLFLRANRIFGNLPLGVDVGTFPSTDGPTPNDVSEADDIQNYPMIQSVDYGASTTVHATLHSKASQTYDVDFFANPICDPRPALYPQGQDYVGSTQVTTNGSGDAPIDFVLPIVLDGGQPVTAIAIDTLGHSSEFSLGIVVSESDRSGPSAGGALDVITGQLFVDGATVTVGGVPATSVAVVNANRINATIPALTPGSLNDLVVTLPGGLSGTLHSAWVSDFNDSPPSGNAFYSDVIKLVANQITVGVGGGNYGLNQDIKRQSMAVFILKAQHGICYIPPPCTGIFADVPCSSNFAPWIEAMANEGITGGCGGGMFCPQNPVRRDQMAVFLLKGKHGSSYVPPPCAGIFGDVPCPGTFADWIEELKSEQVTSGCGGGNYCPSANNKRGQMATFLVKTFGLP